MSGRPSLSDGALARQAGKKIYRVDPPIAGLPRAVNCRVRFVPPLPLLAESLLGVALFRATDTESFTPFGAHHGVCCDRTGSNRQVDFPVGADRVPFASRCAESVDRHDARIVEQAGGYGIIGTRKTFDLAGQMALIPAAVILALLADR